MSLIGSLEDLSLGDILQIISLSQKSGVLVLRAAGGEGRIAFRDGLVAGASVKGGAHDLRSVLVGGGFVCEADFEAADAARRAGGEPVTDVLVAAGLVEAERLDSLRREAVESAVLAMFGWHEGEFSFDVRDTQEDQDPDMLLPAGLNAQYLAMEGARIGDEVSRSGAPSGAQTPADDPDAPEAPGAPGEGDALAAVQALADAALRDAVPGELDIAGDDPGDSHAPCDAAATTASQGASASDPGATRPEAAEPRSGTATDAQAKQPGGAAPVVCADQPIVVIDADLPALEWMKQTLARDFERVHIFQRPDLGLARIRQYLARAISPLLLIAPDTPGDRLSGIQDARDFVRRLKQQAPRLRVGWLVEDGGPVPEEVAPADAVAVRPARHQLRNAAAAEQCAACGERIGEVVAALAAGAAPAALRADAGAIEGLRHVTQRLRDASSRGEVLPLVIDFAAQRFRRVAMFMIRDGLAIGMAQRGLDACGGPDDALLRALQVPVASSAWLREVVETGRPVCGPPGDAGDLALAQALGEQSPPSACLGPIESGGQVVAVVYGDDLPGSAAAVDTAALEVVLHHAGLALDRAMLERALAEAESAAGPAAADEGAP